MNLESLPFIAHIVVKLMALVGLSLYALFAAIIVRQSELMDKVIDEALEPILRVLVLLHLAAAIGLVILAIIII